MQPYQEATQEIIRRKKAPLHLAATAASLAGGSALASKIAPFLSPYIPGNIMRKGLSKINPKLGSFIETAVNHGYGLDEIKSFISNKFDNSHEEAEKENNHEKPMQLDSLQEFEFNYPDISQALARTMQNGQSPQAAAAILKQSSPFAQAIKKLEKDKGKNFVDYIVEIFGNMQNQTAQQLTQPQQSQSSPQGQLDPQLLEIMNNIRQSIGKIKGG